MASDVQADGADLIILQSLRTAEEGAHVSGSELAELLGMSRAAVGKRVALLREQGWTISAVPRLGYRLLEEPDSLHPLCVLGLLRTRALGHTYRFLPEVESTNAELSRLADEGIAEGTVLVADHQRAGRGRLGRRWESPAGANLMFSLLLRPELAPAELPPLSLAAAVGVAAGLAPFLEEAPQVKWPNDLLSAGGKKICGILTELAAEIDRVRHVVIGVGINVNQTRFASALADATSLKREARTTFSRAEVLVSVLESVESWIDRVLEEGQGGREAMLAEWMAWAPWLGGQVEIRSGAERYRAKAIGIDQSGALLLQLRGGAKRRLIAGDVSLAIS